MPLRFLPSVSSWVYSSENSLTLGCESRIEYFGLCSAAFGLHGATSWYRQTVNGGRLASRWFSFVLAPPVKAKDPWEAKA